MAVKDETWISYVAYKLRPEYRVMPEASRFQLAAFLVEVLESPHDRVDVQTYCTVGLRADCDFFVRFTAPSAEELQEISVKVLNSGLGRHLDVAHNWVGHQQDPDAAKVEVSEDGWMAVYPVTLCRKFSALEESDRSRLLAEYAKAGDAYENIRQRSDRAFGHGGPETIVGCEGSDLGEIEAMLRALRATEMHRYLGRASTVLLGRHVPAYTALELCGAL